MKNDFFADIAAKGMGGEQQKLYKPAPREFDGSVCKLERKKAEAIATKSKINTKQELYKKLQIMRKKYSPFLEDHAPKLESINDRLHINEFLLNGVEEIKLPHYGGPLGFAEQVYESEFYINEVEENKAYYICFQGADYIATVYINDICVGQHEGFFSPFEFDISMRLIKGKNTLKVYLQNDYAYKGSPNEQGGFYDGDKLYAATGIGYDESVYGWHHCPPGMGIYHDVFVEVRNRVHISDIFVRPMLQEEKAEVWVEVENCDYQSKDIKFNVSVFGQNFKETVINNYEYTPKTYEKKGVGDVANKSISYKELDIPAKKGKNVYKFYFDINSFKLWEPENPYLYQIQVEVLLNDKVMDAQKKQFGMRDFRQDYSGEEVNGEKLKGMFYLNGKKVRLRGANTMGFEQNDVMNKDFEQLIDDILFAKICNMNFWRLTQRPVQDEVYEYCDKLGLMTQTDLPLFGCMRRNKFAEGLRQAEEMERLIRSHPCNVIISYINEPFPNAMNQPHRHLVRDELEGFFTACDLAVKLHNPDRVIKHVDGDYDPPSEMMPDNHCYNMWYNAHGLDIGKLIKGHWLSVKPGWYYGCGEFGVEGLDFPEIMREYYTKEWLKEPFDPRNIVDAQTDKFHYMFYDTQETIEGWVSESQDHQALAAKVMMEAFRRDDRMITNAIHLFIDAWPSGWMKTIMDFKRNPKPAYFEYRNALEPILISLRTDRFTYFEGEEVSVECFICNDTNTESGNSKIVFELYRGSELIMTNEAIASYRDCDVSRCAKAEFAIDDVDDRQVFTLKAILLSEDNEVITYNTLDIEVFEDVEVPENLDIELIESLSAGEHEIAGSKVIVKNCGMAPVHFVSRNTGHSAVSEFKKHDFRYWYDKKEDMITPILSATFEAEGFTPILTSGNVAKRVGWGKDTWHAELAMAEKVYDGKRYIISLVDLRQENPIAKRLLRNLYKG